MAGACFTTIRASPSRMLDIHNSGSTCPGAPLGVSQHPPLGRVSRTGLPGLPVRIRLDPSRSSEERGNLTGSRLGPRPRMRARRLLRVWCQSCALRAPQMLLTAPTAVDMTRFSVETAGLSGDDARLPTERARFLEDRVSAGREDPADPTDPTDPTDREPYDLHSRPLSRLRSVPGGSA
jgi:hypothetical protein